MVEVGGARPIFKTKKKKKSKEKPKAKKGWRYGSSDRAPSKFKSPEFKSQYHQ
jgi:hypothetical protein